LQTGASTYLGKPAPRWLALVFLRVQTERKASREGYGASLSNKSAFIYGDVF